MLIIKKLSDQLKISRKVHIRFNIITHLLRNPIPLLILISLFKLTINQINISIDKEDYQINKIIIINKK